LVTAPKGFGASAPFYCPPLPRHLSETLDGACPIVASFGRRDPLGMGAPARLRKVLDDKGIEADIKVYQDTGHSFANKLRASFCSGSPDSATTTRRPKTPTAGLHIFQRAPG